MSASRPGNMRGPRVKTPLLLLLLLTGTVLCQYDEPEETGEPDGGEDGNAETSEQPPLFSETTSAPALDTTVAVEKNIEEEQGSGQGRSLIGAEAVEEDDPTTQDEGSGDETSTTVAPEEEEEGLSSVIILIPVVLVVLIIAMIVCGIFINRRWNKKGRDQALRQEDPYLDGSSTEKVPMPMFEEDVPSVLELEMEELDQWMKKDGETAYDSKQA